MERVPDLLQRKRDDRGVVAVEKGRGAEQKQQRAAAAVEPAPGPQPACRCCESATAASKRRVMASKKKSRPTPFGSIACWAGIASSSAWRMMAMFSKGAGRLTPAAANCA